MARLVFGPPRPEQETSGSHALRTMRQALGGPPPFGVTVDGDVEEAVGRLATPGVGGYVAFTITRSQPDTAEGEERPDVVRKVYVNRDLVLWVE